MNYEYKKIIYVINNQGQFDDYGVGIDSSGKKIKNENNGDVILTVEGKAIYEGMEALGKAIKSGSSIYKNTKFDTHHTTKLKGAN